MPKKKPKMPTPCLESISHKCSQPVILEVDGFTIRPFDKDSLWLECRDGEGMQVDKEDFADWLDEKFWEHF